MLKRVPFLLIISVTYIALALGYNITTPLLETPDEIWHYHYVREIAQNYRLPVQQGPQGGPWAQEGNQPPLYYGLSALATWWIDARDYESLIRRNPHAGFDELRPDNRNIYLHGRREFWPWRNAALAMHVARAVSLFGGLLTVIATYGLARTLFPARRDWAVGGAAFVAGLPQFGFLSGAVSNDSWVAALCTLGLWQLARMTRPQHVLRARDFVLLGCVSACATLAKVSGLLLLPLALMLYGWRWLNGRVVQPYISLEAVAGVDALAHQRRWAWRSLPLMCAVFALVAGWWFVRNQWLYGEWLGIETHLDIFGRRAVPLSFWGFWEQWTEIEISFWGLFGWGNVPLPQWLYDLLHGLALLAMGSLCVWGVRGGWRRSEAVGLSLLALWLTFVGASFLRWMMLVNAPHGRLLFPALAAIAILLSAGASWFVPPRWRDVWCVLWGVGWLGLSAFALTNTLAAAFPHPQIVALTPPASERLPEPIRFGDEIQLEGFRVLDEVVKPGRFLHITLLWRAPKAPPAKDYTVTLQLFAADGKRIAHLDTFPVRGMYPTSQWRAEEWLQDEYGLQIADDAPSGEATLIIGLYDHEANRALQIVQADGRRVGRVTLGRVEVR